MKKKSKKVLTALPALLVYTLVFGDNWTGDLATSSGTGTGNTPTINADSGTATSAAETTAAGGTATITITNSRVTTASIVHATICGGSNTGGTPVLLKAVPTANTLTVTIYNAHASDAFNGTLEVAFTIGQPVV